MGSFGGTCEIVESNEELDSVPHSRGSKTQCSGSGISEKVGKLPMLKTGRNYSAENDLKQILEVIDRRTSARSLGIPHQSGTGKSSKNASKKPVRVGTSQAPGIGVSESVTLKQALRGLCISHASEMAAMKRLSMPVASPRVSETGALKRLYKTVTVESSEGGLPLDEGEGGGVLEFSLVPEKSTLNTSGEITECIEVSNANSTNASSHSSPRLVVATNKKAITTHTELKDESIPGSMIVRGKIPIQKLTKKTNPKYAPSLSGSNTTKKVLEVEEIVPASTDVRNKPSTSELVQKGQLHSPHSLSSSRIASKGSKSASNSPRLVNPGVNASTAKPAATRTQPYNEITMLSSSVDMGTVYKMSKSASNSPRLVKPVVNASTAKPTASLQTEITLLSSSVDLGTVYKVSKSASNSPRMIRPLSVTSATTAKPTTARTQPLSESALELSSVDKGNACKVSKSASNSPRMIKSSGSCTTRAKTTTTKIQPRDDAIPEQAEVEGKTSILKATQKAKVKSASSLSSSNTIKKVLEIEDVDPSSKEIVCKTSLKLEVKGGLGSVSSFFGSNTASQVSKSASNSPRLVKPLFRHRSFVKKKVKQDATSLPGSPADLNGVDSDDAFFTKNNLVCRTQNGNPKSFKKESASPECSSISAEAGSSNRFSGPNKGSDRPVGVKAGEKSRLGEKGEFSQSSKSSIGDYSSSTSISEDSNLSGSSFCGNRPHMSKDLRWKAIHHVEMQCGSLGLRNFKLLKRLGCGDIGTVYLAELSGTDCLFAVKVMDNEYLASRKKMPRAQTEREILQMLDHPFLPTLFSHFTTDKFSCLVMEFCPGGDLHVLRQRQPNRSFSEQAARFYVAEVLLALEYLHMLGVVYRDLKPENILVREDGHIMLSDFDLSLRCTVNPTLLKSSAAIMEPAKKLSGPCAESSCIDPFCIQPTWSQVSCFSPRITSATAKSRKVKADLASQVSPLPQLVAEPTSARSNSFVGTHEYLAPEIIKGDGHGSAVDWWTYGIFLYELLFGKTPFKGSSNEDTLANVVLHSLKFPESPAVGFEARELIRALLVKEPDNRLGSAKGATEIKQHPFFEGLNWALIRCNVPPELPKCFDTGDIAVACQKKETECREGEHLEFELF